MEKQHLIPARCREIGDWHRHAEPGRSAVSGPGTTSGLCDALILSEACDHLFVGLVPGAKVPDHIWWSLMNLKVVLYLSDTS